MCVTISKMKTAHKVSGSAKTNTQCTGHTWHKITKDQERSRIYTKIEA
jgi:hypothetical protein